MKPCCSSALIIACTLGDETRNKRSTSRSALGRPVDADRRAARRRQIINGARGVFAREGFHVASTVEISAEAGVSGANLYQYSATKDDLI
ncbi:TetR/AcrR family transcriptional regulator [Massilia genomosp. 1]|uniref:TetR family transcriptional regulator n=1 Tax=Massilia genomosp. 1 TaxID=2609280 RepID=A0ABX0MQL8_9BURK|nr:TetR family transcriptional regulator [Massilia genomosp. 1]